MNELILMDAEKRSELIRVMESSLYPGAQRESIEMVLGYCEAAGLDPMLKPVHIVPMWDSKAGRMRDVVMPGVGLYRTQASRTGQFAGMTEPEFGPDVSANVGGVSITYPEWCRVTVKRILPSGVVAEFTAREYWAENYAVKGGKEKSTAPNAMWQKRPRGQIAKCASAQALRIAFPELGAAPTADEMEGKSLDTDPIGRPAQRHLGDVQRVDVPPEVPEALRVAAEEAALSGVEAYRAHWASLSAADRRALSSLHAGLKLAAEEADASRKADAEAVDAETGEVLA